MRFGSRATTYSERLRSIGARLDASGYHAVAIVEVDDGLIVRASAPGSRKPEVLEVQDGEGDDRARLSKPRGSVPHRLFPGGYETFLTSLGERLDRSQAAAIAIVEGTDFVTVGGIQPVESDGDGVTYEPLDILLVADDIRRILANTAQSTPESAPAPPQEDTISTHSPGAGGGTISRFASRVDAALHFRPADHHPARLRG